MESLTLEQAYYIGELIATVIVILSLLFVAKQLRQNTGAILSQDIGAAIQLGQSELLLHGSKDSAELFQKSINSPESLNLYEIHQLNAWNLMFLIGRSNDYQLYKLGTLSEERWKINEPAVKYTLSGKWHRNWLKVGGRHFFEDEFIEWVESILEKSDFDTNTYYENLTLNA